MINKKMQDKINKYISLGLCALLLLIVLIMFYSSIISTNSFSLRPIDLMRAQKTNDIDFAYFPVLSISFYAYKYFYLVFALIAGVSLFLILYFFVTNNNKISRYINDIMCVLVILLFVSMLIGINYVNVYTTINVSASMKTNGEVFLIIGLLLLIFKFTASIIFGKSNSQDELVESNVSITISFVQMFLILGTLFTPIYIFPGTKYRMRGIDLISGKEDILSFLPMTSAYRAIIIIFIIVASISFITSILFFLIKRKIFIHYNKYNNLLSLTTLVLYALMGANYLLVYVDASAYSTFFNSSMNTYSYIPLTLLIFFLFGSWFTKIAISKLNIEYKVYAKPEETRMDNGQKVGKAIPRPAKSDSQLLDPIPSFSEFDRQINKYNIEYEERLEHTFTDLTLPKLVKHIIDYAKYSREKLSYGPVEIKTFIAGLAASKFAILQGMSGTGKTSLPKIFMEAIDGLCDLVAIESSWRDKNELLGYYNEFNKKYTPKSFTQFLYKASLNPNVPYFIVLDEMNLSRVEYYFSDFLSLMEAREEMRNIKLFDVQLYPRIDERTNYSSLKNGHTIYVPYNVWFIGTANRDESTFEISDKVYDRAQTMNFDKRATKINIIEKIDYPKKFVPYSVLRRLFEETKSLAFDAEKSSIIQKVEELLRPYRISFGNRVLNQIEDFVKAYAACSEIVTSDDYDKIIHEAIDCIISSKVVRKLEFKQNLDIDILIEEFTKLKLPKCSEFLSTLIETI